MYASFALIAVLTVGGANPGMAPVAESIIVRATGLGYPPPGMRAGQARLMARRAAEVTAVRNLATRLQLGPQARLPAFRYVATKNLANGSVEVTVETVAPHAGVCPTTWQKGPRPRGRVGGCR